MFMPDKEGAQPDLLATTGDYLRIWQLKEDGTQLVKLLNNVSTALICVLASLVLFSFHTQGTCMAQGTCKAFWW